VTAKPRVLHIQDRDVFEHFLGLEKHRLSVYTFPNIYVWKGLFDIFWMVIDGELCVFFKDKVSCFLYLPPLGTGKEPAVVEKAFAVMAEHNRDTGLSRIENVSEEDVTLYKKWGFETVLKSRDYLCRQADMAGLRGDRFKSKRAGVNYFRKHYRFAYVPFFPGAAMPCIALYERWMRERGSACKDPVYTGMMRDSLNALKILLRNYARLGCIGRMVKVDGRIRAFTFGFRVNEEVFCVLYEIADREVKGLSQFIFRSFCAELKEYSYINIMDDSGLENLRKVKLSYHPADAVPAYIVQRRGPAGKSTE
jgi:hypothetical protein